MARRRSRTTPSGYRAKERNAFYESIRDRPIRAGNKR